MGLGSIAIRFFGQKRVEGVVGPVCRFPLYLGLGWDILRSGLKYRPSRYPTIWLADPQAHVFFGYYDVSPFDLEGRRVLAMRVGGELASPAPGRSGQVGYYDMSNDGRFVFLGKSNTWCWQQGCRLQWLPSEIGRVVVYNSEVEGSYGCLVQNVNTGEILARHASPVYSVSPDGAWGVGLNFSRLQRLRPGYGYTLLPDETQSESVPAQDGIWRTDFATGESRLLLSCRYIASIQSQESMEGAEHYINHLMVNPDGTRFLFFHLWQSSVGRFGRMMSCSPEGAEVRVLTDRGIVSHYYWKDPDTILCFCDALGEGPGYYLINDRTGELDELRHPWLKEDGHPSYSPDGRWLLLDTYPDKARRQHLFVVDHTLERGGRLGRFFEPPGWTGEIRCDLHPRWDVSGRKVCVDTWHGGMRAMCLVDCSQLTDFRE